MSKLWRTWFLEERPSVSLALFRIALAATVGLHVFPTLFQMRDNYLQGAFREFNLSFFPIPILRWVAGSSDAAVWAMAGVFSVGWLFFLIGLLTRWSGLLMAVGCYYFYARNSLHIGTLSFDILLVTLVLALVTDYPGDSFSVDGALRMDPEPWRRKRPFFVQRLLQLQIAETYFEAGLGKCTAGGNWLSGNPYYYLMNNPPTGVMKHFPLRETLAGMPHLCHALGIALLAFEMTIPLWLFWRRTRPAAIVLAILFQTMLLFTMHVPTIFFFLFPPQALLFLDPEIVVGFIERRRARNASRPQDRLLYDGGCSFCRGSVRSLGALDPTGRVALVDFRELDLKGISPRLTRDACMRRIQFVERDGRLSEGFDAFRRLSLKLPLLRPLAPLLYIPGMRLVGVPAYDFIARHRFEIGAWRPDHDGSADGRGP